MLTLLYRWEHFLQKLFFWGPTKYAWNLYMQTLESSHIKVTIRSFIKPIFKKAIKKVDL